MKRKLNILFKSIYVLCVMENMESIRFLVKFEIEISVIKNVTGRFESQHDVLFTERKTFTKTILFDVLIATVTDIIIRVSYDTGNWCC